MSLSDERFDAIERALLSEALAIGDKSRLIGDDEHLLLSETWTTGAELRKWLAEVGLNRSFVRASKAALDHK